MLARRLLAGSRLVIVVAVVGAFLSAVTLLVYGVLAAAIIAWETFRHLAVTEVTGHGAERLALEFIRLIDVFLLATVLYIVALGLYELFLDPDLPVPRWLRIEELDDLKEKLVGVIIVLLGVEFLGQVVEWDGDGDILAFGTAVGLVIAALGVVFVLRPRHHPAARPSAHETDAGDHAVEG